MAGRSGLAGRPISLLISLFISLLFLGITRADPATLNYEDCFSSSGNLTEKLSITTVYAQLLGETALNITVIGQSNIPIVGRSNDSTKLGRFWFLPFYIIDYY